MHYAALASGSKGNCHALSEDGRTLLIDAGLSLRQIRQRLDGLGLDQVRQQAYRAQRYTRYADVKRLQADGKAIIQIARELKLSRQTVRKYMASEHFPEHARPRQQRSILDPYVDVLQARWDTGCHDNQQLLEAIRAEGYRGSIRAAATGGCG